VIHALAGEQDIRRMGGLRKELPITYWTFLIGALAIAGVPFLSGFFSKDEILFETFSGGHTVLWTAGILTSLLTALYMFRLVFVTFHGERRTDGGAGAHHAHHAAAPAGADAHAGGHGHSHLHDAPPAMAAALVVLAAGSVLAGYIGVPHALGGHNMLAAWLEPAFEARPATGASGMGAAGSAVATQTGEPGAAVAGEAHDDTALELALMGVSTAVAFTGIGLAVFLYLKRRELPARVAERFAGLHRLLLNKYYVDEVYDAAIVRPMRITSQEALWRGFDIGVIDGAVNGMGAIVSGGAWMLRRLQTGSVRAYAGSLFLGVILILGYYLWR
jgi:NADH-quinone oxidoreductase subunit L